MAKVHRAGPADLAVGFAPVVLVRLLERGQKVGQLAQVAARRHLDRRLRAARRAPVGCRDLLQRVARRGERSLELRQPGLQGGSETVQRRFRERNVERRRPGLRVRLDVAETRDEKVSHRRETSL